MMRPIISNKVDVAEGKVRIIGYVVYAIFDKDDRCAYVGMSKDVSRRIVAHWIRNESDVAPLLAADENLRIDIYPMNTCDSVIEAETGRTPQPEWESEVKHARAAEFELCQILKPYLNRRLTYKYEIRLAQSMIESGVLHFSEDEFMALCIAELRKFGVADGRFHEETTILADWYSRLGRI